MSRHYTSQRRHLGRALLAGPGAFLIVLPRLLGAPGESRPSRGSSPAVAALAKAPGAFNILVLGDSYAWQPGLNTSEKTFTLVTQHIATLLDGVRPVATPRVFARSGAVIGIPDYGRPFAAEDSAAPWPGDVADVFWDDPHPGGNTSFAPPSMWTQLARAQMPHSLGYVDPRTVGLVLVSGGGNDVGILNAIAPRAGANHHAELRAWIDTLCGVRMKLFLPAVARAFPNAKIVVTGYPQVVSGYTDSWQLARYLILLGPPAGLVVGLEGLPAGAVVAALATMAAKEASKEQSAAFAEETSKVLQEAVDQVNTLFGERRAVFVDVRSYWDSSHAFAAAESFMWPITAPDAPPDHTAAARDSVCATHGPDPICVYGATGHPNVRGAQAYAAAVDASLDSFGAGWPGNGPLVLTVDRLGMTKTTRTIDVHARDREGQALPATVSLYGLTGPTDAPFTYPATPPAECMEVVVEAGKGSADVRGKPHPMGNLASKKANTCAGTVTKRGYQPASFAP